MESMMTNLRIQHLLIRGIGIVIVFISFLALNVSFLERWTVISPDHHIDSLYLISFITFFRIFFLALGIVLITYPQIVFRAKQMREYVVHSYNKKRMNVPSFSLVFVLSIFFLIYLSSIFLGNSFASNEYNPIKESGITGIFTKFLQTLSYFYKSLIAQLFIEDIDPTKIDIPVYSFYIKQHLIDTLNENLPLSGEEYVEGYLAVDNVTYEAKFRYRGDTFHHWYFPKKSWRIKLKNHQWLNSSNKFNIVNPKLASHLQERLAYSIAENAGLIVPRNFPVALFINNKYEGVYYYSDQIDELFFRMQGKVPGDVFYGELYGDATRNGTLFENKSNWDIIATGDNNDTRALENMGLLIQAVHGSDRDFYIFFNQHLGDEYLKFYALTILLDEYRVDDVHNHKLYFNPTNGMFEPIVWDLMPFMNRSIPLNSDQTNALFSKINTIPQFVEKRNKFLKEFMENMPEEVLFDYIDTVSAAMEYEMKHDVFKDSYDAPWILTYNEWQESIEKLKGAIHDRYIFLQRELDNATLTINVINNRDTTLLVFDVAGQSSVNIKTIQLVTLSDTIAGSQNTLSSQRFCYTVFKDTNFNMLSDAGEKTQEGCTDDAFELVVDLLYPGKNDTLRYTYIVKTDIPYNLTVGTISVSNSITDNKINPHITYLDTVEELPELTPSSSLHPWEIPVSENKTIILDDEVILTEDILLNKGDTLIIKPDTIIKLAPDVSIISYGKIIASGTSTMPISFLPLNNEQPWGAIALQGDGANGSLFSYCVIDGGSGAEHELVHYTGMLSAYNADVSIDHCVFRNNKIMDDAFNAKYSLVNITNSEFSNIFSDAIDLDISEGSIEQNTFVDINGDAIDLMTSSPLVKNNDITNAGDKGISVGEMSNPVIINNTIAASVTGIAIKDKSNPILINNTLVSNNVGVAAYEKNWQYGGGGFGMITGTNLCQNAQPIRIQNSSLIRIEQNGSIIECTESECALLCE